MAECALPTKTAPLGRRGQSLLGKGALLFLPSLTFFVICSFFATVYHWAPALVFIIVAVCIGLGVMQWRQSIAGGHDPLRFYLALECLAATGLAVIIGVLVYRSWLASYWLCVDSHVYTNILPSESADGYLDAGKLVFADDSVVNTNHSVGFKDRHVYCVAPIIEDPLAVQAMGGHMQAVQFWAVGVDCCGARGKFACDDSWDWRARSGLVVRGPDFHPQYLQAALQAEAAFGLPHAFGGHLFVRWLRDPEQLELDYWRTGAGILFVAVLCHLLATIVAAWFINKAMIGDHGWGFR